MAREKLYGLTESQMNAVRDTVRHFMNLYGGGQRGSGNVRGVQPRRAVIAEDLTPPASSLVTMASADFHFLQLQSDGTSIVDPEGPFSCYSDDDGATIERGTRIDVDWIDGRWMIRGAACSPQDALITALDAL
jgi:hypothetical protein